MKKFKMNSKDFVEAVNWSTKSYDSTSEKSHVVLELSKEGKGSLFHENNYSYMKNDFTAFDLDLKEDLQLALEGNFLKRLAAAVKSSRVMEFSLDSKGLGLGVKTETGDFTIPIIDVTIPPEMKIQVLGEVDDEEYFSSLQRLSKLCVGKDGGYFPTLETVDLQFDLKKNEVVMMATDRYTLGEISASFEPSDKAKEYFKEHPHIFLPHNSAALISSDKNSLTSASIITGKRGDKYGYSFANGKQALFATKDVSPIEYGKLKKTSLESATNSLIVNTEELRKALNIVSSLSWEENVIFLEIEENSLLVSDTNKTNTLEVATESIKTDESYRVKFVRSVINDAFFPISTEKVKISWKNDKSPFVFTPLMDNGKEMKNVFVFCVPSTSA